MEGTITFKYWEGGKRVEFQRGSASMQDAEEGIWDLRLPKRRIWVFSCWTVLLK